MNRVEKLSDGTFRLTCESGEVVTGKIWYEKKTDSNHIKFPKDNPSGRQYIRESIFEKELKNGIYEFETKTEHREGLVSGGWRSKLTDEERVEIEELETRIEEIKKIASERKVEKVDPNSPEGIQAQIDKLMKKLQKTQK